MRCHRRRGRSIECLLIENRRVRRAAEEEIPQLLGSRRFTGGLYPPNLTVIRTCEASAIDEIDHTCQCNHHECDLEEEEAAGAKGVISHGRSVEEASGIAEDFGAGERGMGALKNPMTPRRRDAKADKTGLPHSIARYVDDSSLRHALTSTSGSLNGLLDIGFSSWRLGILASWRFSKAPYVFPAGGPTAYPRGAAMAASRWSMIPARCSRSRVRFWLRVRSCGMRISLVR